MPLNERNGNATCTILIVENSDDIRAGLAKELETLGHRVALVSERDDAIARDDLVEFDLVVSDLVNDGGAVTDNQIVRSFKLAVTGMRARRAIPALHDIIERTLSFKLRCIDHRTNIDRFIQSIPQAQLFNPWQQPLQQLFAHCTMHDNTTAGSTALSRCPVGAPQNPLNRKVDIGIIHHDHGIFAAHLQ